VLLLGFGGLGLLVFDDRFNGEAQSETIKVIELADFEISRSQAKIVSTEAKITRITQNRKDLRETLALQEKLDAAQSRVLQMDTLISNEELELDSRKEDFANYRVAYRKEVRTNAIGKNLGTLTTQDGATYENAVVKKVDAFGMTIAYSGGRKRISSKYLSAADQDFFQFSEEEIEAIRKLQEKSARAQKKATSSEKNESDEKNLSPQERQIQKLISRRDKGQNQLKEMRERKNILNQRHNQLVKNRQASQLDQKISQIEKNITIYQQELSKLNKQILHLQNKAKR